MTPRAVAEALYAAYFAQDIPAFLALLHPDIEWESIGPPSLPFAGLYRGHAGAGRFFELFASTLDVVDFRLDGPLIVDGPNVIASGPRHVIVKASGAHVRTPWLHWWRVEDGLAVRHREFQDTAAYL